MCSMKNVTYSSSFLVEARGVKDSDTLESLGVTDGGTLYFKDLGKYDGVCGSGASLE